MEMKFQFCDVFGLDPDLLGMVSQPCISLLLLFPINDKVKLSLMTDYNPADAITESCTRACVDLYFVLVVQSI